MSLNRYDRLDELDLHWMAQGIAFDVVEREVDTAGKYKAPGEDICYLAATAYEADGVEGAGRALLSFWRAYTALIPKDWEKTERAFIDSLEGPLHVGLDFDHITEVIEWMNERLATQGMLLTDRT